MAYTSTDLSNVESAISDVVTGGFTTVTIGGRTLERLDLAALTKLRDDIQSDLNNPDGLRIKRQKINYVRPTE